MFYSKVKIDNVQKLHSVIYCKKCIYCNVMEFDGHVKALTLASINTTAQSEK